ncbi:nucleoside-diphosphate kinase [Clostridium pasteurianum]|uniref:Nucleoside diphosphate kinase n=1 Tax=Clostridium pasteurianum BC1 TaxID=86416 RepID=R4K8V2_CLOPA|nr:nucleoside-diphosphate kinase [Clostridium pasteurianum]AGK98131.1 nucleoside diphosphate kinase [Clostridium pasteurianum BC1]
MERTLVLIKPDGVRRKLIGKIISFYEKKNLNIIALKMLRVNRELAEEHYSQHKGRQYFNELIEYITEGKLCAMVIEGRDAITIVRNINGNKDPKIAPMGSIRGIYASDTTKNLVHASDNMENAEKEIKIWFPEFEIC